MAQIVLGLGTSHGPMLSTPPEDWRLRVPDDMRSTHHFRGRDLSFAELVELRKGEALDKQIEAPVWRARHAACRKAIGRLAEVFEAARIDVAVIVGNDQMEIFDETTIPPFSVLWGDTIANTMYTDERIANLPPGIAISIPGYIPPGGDVYPAFGELGRILVEGLMQRGFDVAAMKRMPKDETPHAFGFVYRQIMNDRPVPSVPVVLNTFYPPNQPSIERCYEFGRALAEIIQSWSADVRVAMIASGGLTHYAIDEAVDRAFLEALRGEDVQAFSAIGEDAFQSGTSEMKDWIPVAAAMNVAGLACELVDYVPCYRSEAGTGNAMGFAYWSK